MSVITEEGEGLLVGEVAKPELGVDGEHARLGHDHVGRHPHKMLLTYNYLGN